MAETAELPGIGPLEAKHRHQALDPIIRILKSPVGSGSGLVILLLVLVAVFAEQIAWNDAYRSSLDTFQSPSLAHPFGTDNIGRDQFARVLHGSRISLQVGLFATFFGVFGGCLVGVVSGYLGGLFDMVVQRVVDALLAFPGIVLVMAVVSVFGLSTRNALLAIGILIIPYTSRVVRSAVFSIKENVYIEAATAVGASPVRVMWRHILPNVVAPILILISALLGGAILIESGLAFLGLGTQPPDPSWGLMLSTVGRQYMEIAPWLAIFPGLAISITVLAFNLFGDVVRDVLDPRLRGSR